MRNHLATTLLVTLALAATGCEKKDEKTPTTAPSASAAPATSAAAALTTDAGAATAAIDAGATEASARMRPVRGTAGLFLVAARDAKPTDEQKTKLEAITKELTDDDPPKGPEGKQAHEDLVAGIKAGKIDEAKMQTHYAAMEKAAQARLDEEAQALGKLHAALTPEQRKAVAADVKARLAKREEHMKKRGDAEDKEREAGRAKKRAERMTKDLGLDADQAKKVEAVVAKHGGKDTGEGHTKKLVAAADAFEKDTFDAKKLEAFTGGGKEAKARVQDDVKLYGELLAIVKPEQREKLAGQIEKRGHGGRGGFHGRGGPEGHERGPRPGGHDDGEE